MAPYDSNIALDLETPAGHADARHHGTVTTRFGDVEVAPEHVVDMPKGPFGFGGLRRFVIADVPGRSASRFKLFQSLDDPDVGFLVLPAAGAHDRIASADFEAACQAYCFDPATSGMFLIATMRRGADGGVETSVNLKAPIVVDTAHRVARQVVFTDDSYPVRAAVGAD